MNKRDKKYLNRFITWYDPHGLVIQNHREINNTAREMVELGYSNDEIYKLVDKARDYWNLSKIERKQANLLSPLNPVMNTPGTMPPLP
jgi:hypothetical protein